MPWETLLAPAIAAEDALARLDERLTKSSLREGWIARSHFSDASASLWNDGEFVHIEDLVLRDAGMDVHLPTPALARAMQIMRARRQLESTEPSWPFSDEGLNKLRGKNAPAMSGDGSSHALMPFISVAGEGEELDAVFSEIDRSLNRIAGAVHGAVQIAQLRDPLVYDPDWDEETRLEVWKGIVTQTNGMPPTVAVAICMNAWNRIDPLQHLSWLGPQLSAALFRTRAKTRSHLFCFNVGLRALGGERPRKADHHSQILLGLRAIRAGAELGLKEHDRWLNARNILDRKLRGRRSTSRLGELIDLVMKRPLISVGLVAKELKITSRAAQTLIAELDLRETTGRSRYRAWSLF